MGKKMLRNPAVHDGSPPREVYVTSPDVLARIAELETQLTIEKAKPAIVKTNHVTVEKEVLRDDPDLLNRYNQAMRELGLLKQSKPEKADPQIVEVTRIVKVMVVNKKVLAAAFALGVSLWPLFTLLGRLIK